jgi:hypothetical protein
VGLYEAVDNGYFVAFMKPNSYLAIVSAMRQHCRAKARPYNNRSSHVRPLVHKQESVGGISRRRFAARTVRARRRLLDPDF